MSQVLWWSTLLVMPMTVPVPGPLTDRIGALAAETGLWLVPGPLFERTPEGAVHNTALVFSPDGESVARYRKVFPWQPYEQAEPGDRFTVFEMPGVGRIGLAICYDGSFPETVRQLAWLGAEVVIRPTLTTTRDREMELLCARANARTNQVYVVNVNTPAPYGVGHSTVADPEGTVRQQAGPGEEAPVDVLGLDAVTRVRRHGSAGINRLWAQLARYGAAIELPMYRDGVIQPPAWQQD
ncbi:carbon-nitrogen hydrolase family protein [Kitasatospora cineracea]